MVALFPDQREAYPQHAADRRDGRPRAAARPAPDPALPGAGRRDRRELAAQGVRARPRRAATGRSRRSSRRASTTSSASSSRMGYAGYFLIVADFIRFAREQGIQTTCRGSAPGSIVTYTLGITPVDPIHYRLPFERFLNPDRVTMPDIDVDFEDGRRDEVISYVSRKYGTGPRRPDHHLRHDARPGGDPRRRPRPRPQLRRRRPDREGRPEPARDPASTRRSRSRTQLREMYDGGPGGQPDHRLREAARGRRPQRLDARRRRRHQPRAADRAHAAPEGDELRRPR